MLRPNKKHGIESLRLRRLSHAPEHLVGRLCRHNMVTFCLALPTAAACHCRTPALSGAIFALRASAGRCGRWHGGRASHFAVDNGSRERRALQDSSNVVRGPAIKVAARDGDAVAQRCAKSTCGIQVAANGGALFCECWTGPAESMNEFELETKRFPDRE